MKKLNIGLIRIDGGTQARESINQEAVQEYAEAIAQGATFPPVTIFFDGAVTRQSLRPHDWHQIWPELAATEPQP